jgi:N-acetylglucosamine repressor
MATTCLPVSGRGGDEALNLVYQILDELIGTGYRPLVGIGVGTPGLVNSPEGVVLKAVNLDWENLPLAKLLQDRFGLPVFVLNDSQAAAMGEFTYGQGHLSESNLVVINARHGLGAGIIIKGRLFQGDGGGAGEIGHIVVQEGGSLCRCGNYGCLETVASIQGLIQQTNQLQPNVSIDPKDLLHAFNEGNPQVERIVLDSARYMGMAISALVGMLNIHQILISGDMTQFGEGWLQVLRETVSGHSFSRLVNETRVDFGHLGKDSILLGASAVLINQYSLLFMRESLAEKT